MNQTRMARTLDTRLAPTYLTEIVSVAREKYNVPAIAVTLMNSETVYRQGFSLGIANGTLGSKRYSAFDGSAGTFFCRSFIIPESDFAITIMMNASSATGSMEAVDWLTIRIVKKHFNWWWKFWL